ncbi:MAG: hypothetical protein LUD22_02475, partial [Coprobacillus sp.]|nr:hypothetical protein [Coprobacillus sp.]
MEEDDINNKSIDKGSDSNLTSVSSSYTGGSSKEISYVASSHPARRERSVNLQIFTFIMVIDALLACLLIGVFWYLSMWVPMYISIGIVSLVVLIDLIFLIYTLTVYSKKIRREDERLKEERYQKMKEKEE